MRNFTGQTNATAGPSSASATGEMPRRFLVIFLTFFAAFSAIGGGIELMVFSDGNAFLPPLDMLDSSPFSSFFFPGLLLAGLVGGASLAAAILVWRRSLWSIDATIFAGGTLTFWIAAELAILQVFHFLHAIYGGLGLVLLAVGLAAARSSRHPRHRWVILVTAAEAIGYLVPALTGVVLVSRGAIQFIAVPLLIAGVVEGAILGYGQALASPLPLDKRRFVLLTSFGTGLAWASAFSVMNLISADLPLPLVVPLALVIGTLGLASIGVAQWFELRRHSSWAHHWISWTALAWLLAVPLSLAPSPFVDASSPLWVHLVLWPIAGILMAHVMAILTWQGVRRIPPILKGNRPGREGLAASRYWGHPETMGSW